MKRAISILTVIVSVACGNSGQKDAASIEMIDEPAKQDSIFNNLMTVTGLLPESVQNDSLAFLILPVQASCPACRKKTIDSIVKHQNQLLPNHYIIISVSGGRKLVSSYFKEEKANLPEIKNKLFLDSTNVAYKRELYTDKPTFYYAHNKKVFKKVAAIPITVREDLREFFSGYRNTKN